MGSITARLSRLRCRLRGHRWSIPAVGRPDGWVMVCTRTACRGRDDSTMRLSGGAR